MSLKVRFIGVFMTVCVWFTAGVVLACGGFFAAVPVDQTSQRMIFTVNGDGTITTIQGIGYEGEASDFVWMLPVPSMPTVEVAELETLDMLDRATQPWIIPPPNPCAALTWTYYGEGVGAGGGFMEGSAGPYDYVVLDEDSADAIVTWLHDNGYNVPDAILPALQEYVDMDLLFLAMKLRPTASVGDIQPVKITYKAANPVISIRFAAASVTSPSMPFSVWIFGDTRYMADNYANPQVDYSQFHAARSSLQESYPRGDTFSEYNRARLNFQQQYAGKAFVTEAAMPTDTITFDMHGSNDPALLELLSSYKYVTRMEALMSADQMTEDVVFKPAPDASDVSPQVDLSEYVDPLQYWKCSTRSLYDYNPDEYLEAYTQVGAAHIGHPANWIQSDFLVAPLILAHAFSPEKVDVNTIRAFIRGEPTPPMFVIFGYGGDTWGQQTLTNFLGVDTYPPDGFRWEGTSRFQLFALVEMGFQLHFELLTTEADYEANSTLYRAMLDYAAGYAYFAHPELRHTLFLSRGIEGYDSDAMYVGFPEGWQAHRTEDELAVILPDGMTDAASSPSIRIYRISADSQYLEERITETLQSYNAAVDSLPPFCPVTMVNAAFEHNSRRGYLQIGHNYYVEASAPAAMFAEYDAVLKHSAESFNMAFLMCG